ncbi:hypothetical protein Pst134EA_021059 [Puccinia striiformis f. sp. tritici]|uniref:hypothetical protein n=1 Tax=Puccinia striiformis f. sp. tritici TaxID=168172 RepID=UPI00200720E6|nr:hypothetical protein Pst134EA_021059 [Puccinia striiformis f. sp. tritici]KAH9457169.1 hypothetical protein Pst134EA_021059 [Puccinia striiformis f. sp. tritici]
MVRFLRTCLARLIMDPPPTEKAYSPPGSHVSFLSSPKGISIFIMTVGPMEHLKCASITGASYMPMRPRTCLSHQCTDMAVRVEAQQAGPSSRTR